METKKIRSWAWIFLIGGLLIALIGFLLLWFDFKGPEGWIVIIIGVAVILIANPITKILEKKETEEEIVKKAGFSS